MSPRRRTLCYVLILLSLNDDLVLAACFGIGPGLSTQPVITEVIQTSESPIFPGNPRLTETFKFGSFPQSFNTISNYPVPRPNSFTTYSTYVSPVELTNSLQTPLPITDQIESVTVIDQNYPPVTQTVQVETYTPTVNVAEVCQSPIALQFTPTPQFSPFVTVASPVPGIMPTQTFIEEVITPAVVSEIVPQVIETEITTVTSVPVEPTLPVPVTPCEPGFFGQQLPLTLQINVPSPYIPEPVITVISPQPASAPPAPISSSSCDYPSYGMPPVIVMENSRSKWKSILPILILSLFDGGFGNNGCGGCCNSRSSTTIPVPFPIPIPINNPIICSRGKGKSKAKNSQKSSGSGDNDW